LVARGNELDAIAGVVERIEHADVAMPADAKHIGNLVGDQVFRDQLCALHPRHEIHSVPSMHAATIAHPPAELLRRETACCEAPCGQRGAFAARHPWGLQWAQRGHHPPLSLRSPHPGRWHTASMLWPSGSRTKAP